MANMSYCRFVNTSDDLGDCLDHIDDNLVSQAEQKARVKLIETCQSILEALGYEVKSPDELESDDNEFDDADLDDGE